MCWKHLHTWHYLALPNLELMATVNDNTLEWMVKNNKDEIQGKGTGSSVAQAKVDAENCIVKL